MKKPKIKKRRGYWLVYLNKKEVFKCFNENTALFYYEFLKNSARGGANCSI